MQSQDLVCSECQCEFSTASSLLQHFAAHASKSMTHKKLPDLYPIKSGKAVDSDIDSGVEDIIPIEFCLVTMNEQGKKYQCEYCFKRFGWSTDLKRHTLIHTGERPFKCGLCDCGFTRNFLLKKHQRKCHKLPDLKPLVKPM